MEIKDLPPINETSIKQLIEHLRFSYSQILNLYIQLFEKYAQFKKKPVEISLKTLMWQTDPFFYNDEEKINWDVVRQLMPPNLENLLREKYSMLNDNEIRLCCLLYLGVSRKKISSIKLYKEGSIRMMKHLIKKKTGSQNISDLFRDITLSHF